MCRRVTLIAHKVARTGCNATGLLLVFRESSFNASLWGCDCEGLYPEGSNIVTSQSDWGSMNPARSESDFDGTQGIRCSLPLTHSSEGATAKVYIL